MTDVIWALIGIVIFSLAGCLIFWVSSMHLFTASAAGFVIVWFLFTLYVTFMVHGTGDYNRHCNW